MNILLIGINAKYIHSCLAVHLLAAYARQEYGICCETVEYTINQSEDLILGEICRKKPDLIGFSCYIWNYELVQRLVRILRRVLPETRILLGGPEVGFDSPAVLAQTGADFILSGEGEEPFAQLCRALLESRPLSEVPSLTYRQGEEIHQTSPAPPLDLAKLPFVYEDLSFYENRILYYEAQRGCPFNCQYCLSSAEKGVRFQPLDKVCRELRFFLEHRVPQVKFVDRTFNANPRFALAIWRFLQENDNGVTNFHFELAADCITEEMLEFFSLVRPGLFQFEIGVQSTYEPTLQAIDRRTPFAEVCRTVRRIQQAGNIHLHLDLIAGLPYEGYTRFGQSFDEVYSLRPDQFQLGFLKLLKGSGLRRDQERFGIAARETAPYEVLFTDALSFEELLQLKEIEDLTELYYHSGRFRQSLEYLNSRVESPFRFFEGFAWFRREQGAHLQTPGKLEQYSLLYHYGCSLPGCNPLELRWRMKFDLYSHEKARKLPEWLTEDETSARRNQVFDFYQAALSRGALLPEYAGLEYKQVAKMAHLEFFPFDPRKPEGSGRAVLLFNYRRPDLLGNAAVTDVTSWFRE